MAPSLPAEIWRQIFQHLCIHCQQSKHSDNLPDFRLPCAREGKAALRNLSLVSRECRAMSQDILFHYFYNISQGGAFTPTTKDLTPRMLRTLISSPHLAKEIRMVALFDQHNTSNLYAGITRQDLQSWSEVSRSHNLMVLKEITTALECEGVDKNAVLYFDQPGPAALLQIPPQELEEDSDEEDSDEEDSGEEDSDEEDSEDGNSEDEDSDEESDSDDSDEDEHEHEQEDSEANENEDEYYNYHFRYDFYEWMYCLLLKLAPNVTHVQLHEPFNPFDGHPMRKLPARIPSFPHVRVLTYNGFYEDHKDVIRSFTQFPNLSNLGCYDGWYTQGISFDPMHSGHPQTNIRKLSFTCWPDALSDLLKCCPELEDLEVHINRPSILDGREWDFEWPAHTKANLRRLVWSDDETSEFLVNVNHSKAVLPPIMDLQSLEILEIDQASLLLHSRSQAGGISTYVLPGSLRILHIAFAQDVSSVAEISDSLRELATAKATVLPNLAIVKVDHPPSSTEGNANLAEAMHASGLVSCMALAGIKLTFELEEPLELRTSRSGTFDARSRRDFFAMRRIAPLLVGSTITHVDTQDEPEDHQCELFSLEDLASL